jgi:hypothetical protein
MMAEMFRIAGQNIRIAGGSFCRLLSGFEAPAERKDDPDVCRVTLTEGYTQFDISSVTPDHPVAHVFGIHSCLGHFMVSDEDYSNSTGLVIHPRDEGVLELILAALYSHMAERARTVFVHASLIEMPGRGGVMFVGRSGIGKTTQARLWEKFRGAEIINGDKVFLTLDDDGNGVTAHGSPWCGSSPYKLNRTTSLRGIVVLDQAPENSIRQLSEPEIMTQYVSHIFLPMWDAHLTDCVMEAIGGMMPLVPVFRLSCRPDEEAVDLTYRSVFGETAG